MGACPADNGPPRSKAFHIEEDFDLAALGFEDFATADASDPNRDTGDGCNDLVASPAAASMGQHGHKYTSPQDVKRGGAFRVALTSPPPIDSPRPILSRGKYSSADWSPEEDRCGRAAHSRSVGKQGPGAGASMTSVTSGCSEGRANEAEQVKVKDFAGQGVGETHEGRDTAVERRDEETLDCSEPSAQASSTPPTSSIMTGTESNTTALTSTSSTPSLASGIITTTETASATDSNKGDLGSPRPLYRAKLVVVRRPGRRHPRVGIRITQIKSRPIEPISTPEPERAPSPDPPPSDLTRAFAITFAREQLDSVTSLAKEHNTTGHLLPTVLRDLFPLLSEAQAAVQIANELRATLDLPLLSTRTDRVALHRTLAQTRERLYVELVAALALPLAPPPNPPSEEDDDAEQAEKPSLALTPSSLRTMATDLPAAFTHDRAAIKAYLAAGREYGEPGNVVWRAGVGTMLDMRGTGVGYRGEVSTEPGLHVFVDHSNILHGLLHQLYNDPRPLPPKHQRVLSFPCLSLLLCRGRPTPPGTMHLVASAPLVQDLDPLVRLGWEVSVLKRVEVYEAEVEDATAVKLTPRATRGVVSGPAARGTTPVGSPRIGQGQPNGKSDLIDAHSGSPAPAQSSPRLPTLSTAFTSHAAPRRFKEQAVDEILTLKILHLLTSNPSVSASTSSHPHSRPTIVLATGDARGGQFHPPGFLGAVRAAVASGWCVELWSFSSGLSRAWRETARREGWGRGVFRVMLMDEWAGVLVEVNED